MVAGHQELTTLVKNTIEEKTVRTYQNVVYCNGKANI